MSDKKIEAFWRDAKAEDVARVMKGETVEARFRDSAARDWQIGHLNGWADGEFRCELANCWVHCQVYDPPEWYTNKPDPGLGYRLLGKFPDEPVRGGDFIYGSDGVWVELRNECNPTQGLGLWYRRRIEAVEPEPKHYVLRVGDSFETPSGQLIKVVSPGVEQIEFKLKAGFTAKLPNGQTITATEKGFEVKHD
jgi:hypothetical protein